MTYREDNPRARDRILSLVSGLTDAEMAVPNADGWTIAAQLAHLAFWDRAHIGRLRAALDAGRDLPVRLSQEASDALNDSGLHGWRLVPGAAAVLLFAEASAEVDAYVASLEPSVVVRVRAAGLDRNVDRFRHRIEHGADIEAALGRS